MRKVVIKIGTNVITRDSGLLNRPIVNELVKQIGSLKKKGIDVIVVTSGAVAAGRSRLGRRARSRDAVVVDKQVLAAVGQVKLMEIYSRLFGAEGYSCAQVLATKGDFRDRRHYLCMQECFKALLHENIVPVVNENDVVAVSELMFTDNDELAGLIAAMLDVDALIILTSVDGLYDRDPREPGAQLLESIQPDEVDLSKQLEMTEGKSKFGRGGMHTKCRVAQKLAAMGITTFVANGKRPQVLSKLFAGESVGTKFIPGKRLSGVKKWIGHSHAQVKGSVTVNKCAEELLLSRSRAVSLLPVGLTKVDGDFQKGDIIRIQGEGGSELGIGVARYGADATRRILGMKSKPALIHHDYLYLHH